eukprot:2528556-Prymnesium_polylepis.1
MAKSTFVLNGALGLSEQQRSTFALLAVEATIDDIMATLPEKLASSRPISACSRRAALSLPRPRSRRLPPTSS